jgi:hypothetical protein
MAPLLRKLIDTHRATGLPPAYLPKHDLVARDDARDAIHEEAP